MTAESQMYFDAGKTPGTGKECLQYHVPRSIIFLGTLSSSRITACLGHHGTVLTSCHCLARHAHLGAMVSGPTVGHESMPWILPKRLALPSLYRVGTCTLTGTLSTTVPSIAITSGRGASFIRWLLRVRCGASSSSLSFSMLRHGV